MKYPLAAEAVYRTIQGEGTLCGLPMTFVRFAGCPVACAECDTDYRLRSTITLDDLVKHIENHTPARRDEWCWLTGGEPAIHDLSPLVAQLHDHGKKVALATSGHFPIAGAFDFISVSPHRPDPLKTERADELKLLIGLNGYQLHQMETRRDLYESLTANLFISPACGDQFALRHALSWVERYPRWRLGWQAHKQWRLP